VTLDGLLRDQFVDHFPAKLAQLFEAAGVVVSETVVVETQQMQQRDVDVADVPPPANHMAIALAL
jgi:hypothetical protein